MLDILNILRCIVPTRKFEMFSVLKRINAMSEFSKKLLPRDLMHRDGKVRCCFKILDLGLWFHGVELDVFGWFFSREVRQTSKSVERKGEGRGILSGVCYQMEVWGKSC